VWKKDAELIMFEICYQDIENFHIKSIVLYEPTDSRCGIVLAVDALMVHKDIPKVQIKATGGLTATGGFDFRIKPENPQDIMSQAAIGVVEMSLIEVMDQLMDFAFRAHIKMY
jgi:hypothetical protein